MEPAAVERSMRLFARELISELSTWGAHLRLIVRADATEPFSRRSGYLCGEETVTIRSALTFLSRTRRPSG